MLTSLASFDAGSGVLTLSGAVGPAQARELKSVLLDSLESPGGHLLVRLDSDVSGGLTLFQCLFALAAEAASRGKVVELDPLPEPLRRAADALGITQRMFDQAFVREDAQ